MPKLVFDIETSRLPVEHFDEAQQEYLFREAEKEPDSTRREQKREEIYNWFSLWPFTAQVVCIAMMNVNSAKGQVLFLADDFESPLPDHPMVKFTPCMDESELLTSFWEIARRYDSVVTFNGRSFDVPFLYLRSAHLNVPITAKNWLGYRFQTEPHCDLADQLSFYGVSGKEGAARRFNLDFYCRAFGIESPKSQGVSGSDVSQLLSDGKYLDIAEYCLRDVEATCQLYQLWKDRLSGIK